MPSPIWSQRTAVTRPLWIITMQWHRRAACHHVNHRQMAPTIKRLPAAFIRCPMATIFPIRWGVNMAPVSVAMKPFHRYRWNRNRIRRPPCIMPHRIQLTPMAHSINRSTSRIMPAFICITKIHPPQAGIQHQRKLIRSKSILISVGKALSRMHKHIQYIGILSTFEFLFINSSPMCVAARYAITLCGIVYNSCEVISRCMNLVSKIAVSI